MVRDPVRVVRAHVLHPEHVHEQFGQLVRAGRHRLGAGGQRGVAGRRRDHGVLVPYRSDARPGRRDGVWRIKDRRTIAQWSTSRPMGEDFMRGDLFLAGQRDPSDIAHEVLGLKEGCARIAA